MDRTIVINGAGGGLGVALTQLHLEQNDRVYAFDLRISEPLESLRRQYPNLLRLVVCDLSDDDAVRSAAQTVLEEVQCVSILYNAAGLYIAEEKVGIEKMHMEQCKKMFEVNALGPLRMCQALLSLLKKGSVVANISSEAGSVTACRRTDDIGYCMSKAALNMGSKLLSNTLWARGARVMVFHPGWMRTAMGGKGAMESKLSVSPEESAQDIVGLLEDIDAIPRDQLFMDHRGNLLPW